MAKLLGLTFHIREKRLNLDTYVSIPSGGNSVLPQKVLHLHIEERKKKPNINHKYMLSGKLDGIYGYIDYKNGIWGHVTSRAGRVIPAMYHARELFTTLPTPEEPTRFIFECYIPGMAFHTQNGIFNRANYQATETQFYLHDRVLLNKLNEPAQDRFIRLEELQSYLPMNLHIQPVLLITSDREKWFAVAKGILDAGGEGIVLKQASAGYSPDKRNASLMKIKLEEIYHLYCINMYKTVGEKGNENLNLLLKDNTGVTVPVRVGKYTDIAAFEKTSPVGRLVRIKAMCKLPDGSYREPRFVCLV